MTLINPNKESEIKSSEGVVKSPVEESDDLNRQYVDRRSVTISLVKNYSNYRKVNIKTMGEKKEVIGSSIRSCQILTANAKEIAKYFPAIIGLSETNPDFITRVKAWLSNIQIPVNDANVTLNTTFIYDKKSDYLAIKAQEDKINEEYDAIPRYNLSALAQGLKKKVEALNTLESSKFQYGQPENVTDYLMYRHCLLYKDVAKDVALINGDPSIRFYIKDEAKEAEKAKKLVLEKKKAMNAFIDITSTDAKFNAAFISIIVARGDNLAEAVLKDRSEKEAIMMNYVNDNPAKFNKIVADKHLEIKAKIETLIARGELVRSEYNQQISTADGQFVGSNINEAIAWFENPANADLANAYENKLKLF